MFLCEDCHAKSGCDWPTFIELPSRGTCEVCRKDAICSDCHHYGPVRTTESEAS